ncbi:hypothetical protein TRFO_01912 [Tritrichomonas foetus]|uniref:Uncharacterized protein n=1 Tax=Tritrichomonas foetus TaxID=1144522 RepID=A0A1J4JJP3_9EUKA|nr:hypothetical protein TRFO_01912 [Tritrichomonas foetus]|eukprot:OHS98833.1 hypothetical protein TRFO_01912 [Tritrichomonas foetus]
MVKSKDGKKIKSLELFESYGSENVQIFGANKPFFALFPSKSDIYIVSTKSQTLSFSLFSINENCENIEIYQNQYESLIFSGDSIDDNKKLKSKVPKCILVEPDSDISVEVAATFPQNKVNCQVNDEKVDLLSSEFSKNYSVPLSIFVVADELSEASGLSQNEYYKINITYTGESLLPDNNQTESPSIPSPTPTATEEMPIFMVFSRFAVSVTVAIGFGIVILVMAAIFVYYRRNQEMVEDPNNSPALQTRNNNNNHNHHHENNHRIEGIEDTPYVIKAPDFSEELDPEMPKEKIDEKSEDISQVDPYGIDENKQEEVIELTVHEEDEKGAKRREKEKIKANPYDYETDECV